MEFRGDFEKGMVRNMYDWYFERYDQLAPVHPQICEMKDIGDGEGQYVQDTSVLGMGRLTKRPEGDTIVESNIREGYTIWGTWYTYSDSTGVTMELNADLPKEKIVNLLREQTTTWAESNVVEREYAVADLFNKGGFTAGHSSFFQPGTPATYGNFIYDGKPWFALSGNNHPSKNGGTYYNATANALSETNLQTAWLLYTSTNAYNERDQKIVLMPDTLLIPPDLSFTAKVLLETDLKVGSGNNDINTAKGLLNPVMWRYLDDTNAWYLGAAKKGIVFLNRMNGVLDFWQDSRTKKYYASIDTRFGAYIKNWRFWLSNNLSTS